MSDFNSLVQYTVENISRPVKYIIYKLTEFIRVVDKFVFRQIPSGAASGYANIEKVEGNTVKFNQISDSNATYSYTFPSDTSVYFHTLSLTQNIALQSGHVYIIIITCNRSISGDDRFSAQFLSGNGTIVCSVFAQSGLTLLGGINSISSDYILKSIRINNYSYKRGFNAGDWVTLSQVQFVDLTAIFDAGNEPTTVEEYEQWREQNGLPSVAAYNAGELLSVKMNGMQTEDSSQQTLDTLPFDITTITGLNSITNTREVIFADGMKQADRDGTIKDTLDLRSDTATVNVGSRAYQAGDESDTDVITDGTTTYYALTTPIEYTDLQDANGNPLNPRYKVEQGGTEQVLPVNTSTPTTVAPTLTTTYTKDNN